MVIERTWGLVEIQNAKDSISYLTHRNLKNTSIKSREEVKAFFSIIYNDR